MNVFHCASAYETFHLVCFCFLTECRDVLLPMMLRELSGALASMADGPHDERRNSLELLNNILEVLSRENVVRRQRFVVKNTCCSVSTCIKLHSGCFCVDRSVTKPSKNIQMISLGLICIYSRVQSIYCGAFDLTQDNLLYSVAALMIKMSADNNGTETNKIING